MPGMGDTGRSQQLGEQRPSSMRWLKVCKAEGCKHRPPQRNWTCSHKDERNAVEPHVRRPVVGPGGRSSTRRKGTQGVVGFEETGEHVP